MDAKTLQSAYARLREAHEDLLPEMAVGGFTLETQVLDDPDDLWAALAAARPRCGWFQCQSHQQVFTDGLPEHDADWG